MSSHVPWMLAHYMWHLGAYATMCRPYAGHTLAHASKTDTSTARWEVRGGAWRITGINRHRMFWGQWREMDSRSFELWWSLAQAGRGAGSQTCVLYVSNMCTTAYGSCYGYQLLLWWMWELLANKMPGSCVYHEGWVVAGYVTVFTVSLAIQLKHNFAFPITATGGA